MQHKLCSIMCCYHQMNLAQTESVPYSEYLDTNQYLLKGPHCILCFYYESIILSYG